MNRNKLFSLVIALSCLCSSCEKDILNTPPLDRISDEDFWKTDKDGVLAVNACYLGFDVFSLFDFEGCSDNAITAKTWIGGYQVANGSFNSSWSLVHDTWGGLYTAIRRTNDVLSNVDKIEEIDGTLKKRLIGEAKALRAYFYTLLISLYGDVVLITEPVSAVNDVLKPREAKANIYAFIKSELESAAQDLPVSYPDETDRGRITKGAAFAILARAALFNEDYEQARTAAQAVIDLATYGLLPRYGGLFEYASENNNEVILDNEFMPVNRTHSSFLWMGPRSSEGLSFYVPTRSLVDEYESGDTRSASTIMYPGEMNPYENGSIVFDPTPGSGTADEAGLSYDATSTGYQYKKYVLKEDRVLNTQCSINYILLRYAEILLIFAEADNELNGPTADGYAAINQVRFRARPDDHKTDGTVLPDITAASKDSFRELIRHERRIELAGEGLRYFDLLRWKIAEDVLNATVKGMDYNDAVSGAPKTITLETRKFDKNKNYLWPIPESELRLNPELTQNPGY